MKSFSLFQKKYVLLALGLLFVWLGWQLAFKKTFEVYSQYKALYGQDGNNSELSDPEAYNVRRQQNLETILKGYRQDSTAFRNNLLYQVAYQAGRQNVKVVQVPMQEEAINDRVLQKITFQGSYVGLIHLLNELKKVVGIGKICSVQIGHLTQINRPSTITMNIYFVCFVNPN